jgi:hypothetical protein
MTIEKEVSEILEGLFDEIVHFQKEKLLKLARRIIPHLTQDDILQPNDFPELENNPIFRYEEGVCEGLLTAKMLYLRFKREQQEGNEL